jgi:HlyD family secretion protein
MRVIRLALPLLVAVTAAGVAVPLIHARSEPETGAAPERSWADPMRPDTVAAPGVVEPVSGEREIAAEVQGRLKAVLGDAGDHVAAGQVLAELDNDDLRAKVLAAQADVTRRQSELERLRAGARAEERQEAEAALKEAEANLALAKLDLNRRKPLAKTGVVSDQVMDQTRTALAAAEARRAILQARLALVTAPPRAEDVAIAEANLMAAKATAAEARAQLEKTIIRSPIDGIVLRREKRTGETVTDMPLTTIVTVGDTSRLRVRAEIDENDVARIAAGQRAYVRADAYGDRRFPGTVSKIGSRVGAKRIFTGAATEKHDTKVLEAFVDLDENVHLPIGLRVEVFITASPGKSATAGRAAASR